MPKRVFARNNPDLLRWARETLGLSIDEAAERIGVSAEALQLAERGEAALSVPQLRKAASLYKRPFALFFLPQVPEEPESPPDFRLLPEAFGQPLNPALLLAIRKVRHKRAAAVSLGDVDAFDWSFIGSRRRPTDPEKQGNWVRKFLGIRGDETWRDHYQAFRFWRERIESKGVLIFQISGIDVKEMRGFSFAGTPFPAIALNRKDAPRGRIFSLLHEFTHLLLGTSGLCDLHEGGHPKQAKHLALEQYCNHVAGAALVPASLLLVEADPHQSLSWDVKDLTRLAHRFMVSREVVLRRLLILGRTSQRFYRQMKDQWAKEGKVKPAGEPRERIHEKVLRMQGQNYVQLVLDALHQDLITAPEASDYLDMKLKHLEKLEQMLAG